MADPIFRSDFTVIELGHFGDDKEIVEDARTSVRRAGHSAPPRADDRTLTDADRALLRELLAHGHASVLRGCILKVHLEVPIFLQREIRTHWVGMKQTWAPFDESDFLGFNDQSGRYRTYAPIFWLPRPERPLLEPPDFTPMAAQAVPAPSELVTNWIAQLRESYRVAWETYKELRAAGVAREVARTILPEGTYVAGRITANVNAWLGFLALRTRDPGAAIPSFPQLEMDELARQIERIIAQRWPAAYEAWSELGRRRL